MQYVFKPSFDSAFKKIKRSSQIKVNEAINDLMIFFESSQKPIGLGLKRLHKDFWEIRIDIKNRIIFRFVADSVEFVMVGSHDEIRRFLKNIR